MFKVVWKCEFRIFSNPYANPKGKKRIGTKKKHRRSAFGAEQRLPRANNVQHTQCVWNKDCLSVKWMADVMALSSTVIFRLYKPIVDCLSVQKEYQIQRSVVKLWRQMR